MYISKWNENLNSEHLSQEQLDYLCSLPDTLPSIEWVWGEMDHVWDDCGLDNKLPIAAQDVGKFYGHPVWIMNGIFTAIDPVSKKHRNSIASYLKQNALWDIADFGGGSGVLAEAILATDERFSVDIIEPFAFEYFKSNLASTARVNYLSDFNGSYDAVVAQDVLEHLDDPIETAFKVAIPARVDGIVIFANCFHPFIKCHLPTTFHLRYTFKWVMCKMGLLYVGRIPGAEHALVFRKIQPLSLVKAQNAEKIARIIGPGLNLLASIIGRLKRRFQ